MNMCHEWDDCCVSACVGKQTTPHACHTVCQHLHDELMQSGRVLTACTLVHRPDCICNRQGVISSIRKAARAFNMHTPAHVTLHVCRMSVQNGIACVFICRPQVNWAMQPSCPKGEVMSLMPYASDPLGLYQCIQRSSAYGIPVYVTETGFPTFDHDHMQTVLDRYLKEVSLQMYMPVLIIAPLSMVAGNTPTAQQREVVGMAT